ncbi:MAG: M13 family metallopeptidase [Propionibacteriaceae bacterium]|jgi:putative endopeptidase|nr:M13 family metallopeptidase [Propionibacteriaceae bacterium]
MRSLLAYSDATVRPQDDLFRFTNATFLTEATIPADQDAVGVWHEVHGRVRHDLENIIAAIGVGHRRGTPEQLVGDFYASFVDLPRIAAKGDALLHELVVDAAAFSDLTGLSARFGMLLRHQLDSILRFCVVSDPNEPTSYLPRFSPGGIGLPNRDYYTDPAHQELRAAYRRHMLQLLTLVALPDADVIAERAYNLETELAALHESVSDARRVESEAGRRRLWRIKRWMPSLDWDAMLGELGLAGSADPYLLVPNENYLKAVAALLTTERLADWRAWMIWRVVEGLADYAPAPIANAHWEFIDHWYAGLDVPQPRKRRALSYLEHFLAEAMGQLYTQLRYPTQTAVHIERLVAEIASEYSTTIANAHWLTPATRKRALHKLAWLGARLGAPKSWHDYSTLLIEPDDLLGNALRATSHLTETAVNRLFANDSVDQWQIPPHVVNSYYDLSKNQIVFPAAFLQPPFFDPELDDAANYGAIGAIIAHEMSHAFDDRGSHFDGEGHLAEWWLPEDRERYAEIVERFSAQLSAIGLNGHLVVDEAIADLGGLLVSYRAWRRTITENEPEPIEGLSAKQRFFISYAGIWRILMRPEESSARKANDPHPPAQVRCNQIVRNFDPFFAAFGVVPSDKMWLPPRERITLW